MKFIVLLFAASASLPLFAQQKHVSIDQVINDDGKKMLNRLKVTVEEKAATGGRLLHQSAACCLVDHE